MKLSLKTYLLFFHLLSLPVLYGQKMYVGAGAPITGSFLKAGVILIPQKSMWGYYQTIEHANEEGEDYLRFPGGVFLRAYKNIYLSAGIDPINLVQPNNGLRRELGVAYVHPNFGILINYSLGNESREFNGFSGMLWVPIF